MTAEPSVGRRVAVVIPVLDSAATLGACLASVMGPGVVEAEDVLVVDNGSSDGSGQVAAASGARVLTCARRGPAAARNEGLAALEGSDHEFVAFVDADAVLDDGWFSEGLTFLSRDAASGGVGGIARSFGDSVAERALDASLWGAGSAASGTRAVDTLATMNALFRAEAIAGLRFDERLVAGEDPEFSFAVRDRGWLLHLDGAMHLRHRNPERVDALFRKWFGYGRYYPAPYLMHPRRIGVLVVGRMLALPALVAITVAGIVLGRPWLGAALTAGLLVAGLVALLARMWSAAGGAMGEAMTLAAVHLGKACAHNAGIWAGASRLWGLATPGSGRARA